MRWRWVEGEDWRVEGAHGEKGGHHRKQDVKDKVGLSGESGEGWVYYDNKVWFPHHGFGKGVPVLIV